MEYLTNQQIEGILKDVVDLFLIPKFDSLGLNATGEWKANVEVRGNEIWGRNYSEQLVYGRSGGTYPPIAPLQRWAVAKFGYDEKRALSMAFAVSKKIQKEGTEIYKNGGTDLVAVLKSEPVIRFINEQAGNFITNQITGQLTNYIKQSF